MRSLWLFILWACLMVLVSLVLIPIVCWVGLEFDPESKIKNIASPVIVVSAIVAFVLIARYLDTGKPVDWGYRVKGKPFLRHLLLGIFAGFLGILALFVAEYMLEIRLWRNDRTPAELVTAFGAGLLNGMLVGFFEETVFRGALYNAIRKQGVWAAIIGTSLIYSFAHFLKTDIRSLDCISWRTGFVIWGDVASNYTHVTVAGPLLALMTFGMILGLLRERFGHIASAIGTHCGAVAMIKLGKKATFLDYNSSLRWMVIGWDKVTGYLAFFILFFAAIIVYLCVRRKAGLRP